MGKWIRRFLQRTEMSADRVDISAEITQSAQTKTDSVDTLSITSTLSVPNRAHCKDVHAVKAASSSTIADPVGPCLHCGSGQWWQLAGGAWHCRACKPDMPLEATTLTLSGHHKEHVLPVGSHAGLDHMMEVTCEGFGLIPDELCQTLGDGSDLTGGETWISRQKD